MTLSNLSRLASKGRLKLRRFWLTLPKLTRIERAYRNLRASLDESALDAVIEECGDLEERRKYLDTGRHLRAGVARAVLLDLDRQKPGSVLDLGCGGGHFLLACRFFGHQIHGLDVDKFTIFNRLIQAFDIPRTVAAIEPFTPLPLEEKTYDWITAFYIAFDRFTPRETRGRWSRDEWKFLLDDLGRRLNETGTICLRFNFLLSEYPDLHAFFAAPPGFTSQLIDDANVLLKRQI